MATPLRQYRKGRETVYAISDRRALILCRVPRISVRSFQPRDIGELELSFSKNGSGNIVFHRTLVSGGRNQQIKRSGFFGIADPQRVEAELAKLRASAS